MVDAAQKAVIIAQASVALDQAWDVFDEWRSQHPNFDRTEQQEQQYESHNTYVKKRFAELKEKSAILSNAQETAFQYLRLSSILPSTTVMLESNQIFDEIKDIKDWKHGDVRDIPALSKFMEPYGGCTTKGKLYWREEEKQVFHCCIKH